MLILNPDLSLAPQAARRLLDAALSDRDTLTAPVIRRPDGSVWSRGGDARPAPGHHAVLARRRRTGRLAQRCVPAVSLDAWTRLGGFDTRYFLYWEDVDLSWRARQAGLTLVVDAAAEATHDVGGTQEHAGSRRKSDLYYAQNCRGRLVFAAHHLAAGGRGRWIAGSPRYGWRVVKRGGRRQLLSGPGPLLAAARGTASGAWYALRRRAAWSAA